MRGINEELNRSRINKANAESILGSAILSKLRGLFRKRMAEPCIKKFY